MHENDIGTILADITQTPGAYFHRLSLEEVFRADFLIADKVIVELKLVEQNNKAHQFIRSTRVTTQS